MTGHNPDRIIPKNWAMVPLGRLGYWTGGGTPSKGNPTFWTGGHIPWVSPKDMKTDCIRDSQDHITEEAVAHSTTKLVRPGSVLVVTRSGILAHTLPVAVSGVPVALNQDLKALEPPPGVSGEYIAKALQAFASDILKQCTKHGTTVHSVEVPKLLAYEIPVAPTAEQRRVAETIDSYLTRLEATHVVLEKVQANLKRYRAAVLETAVWGRLVPTEAELAQREQREYEPAAVLMREILEERRSRWEEAVRSRASEPRGSVTIPGTRYREPINPEGLGITKLPKGWILATVDQLAEVGTGATPRRGNARFYANGTIPWVTSSAVNMGLITTVSEFVTETALSETNLTLYPPGTLLVAMYGEGQTRGTCAELGVRATTNQALAALVLQGIASVLSLTLVYNA